MHKTQVGIGAQKEKRSVGHELFLHLDSDTKSNEHVTRNVRAQCSISLKDADKDTRGQVKSDRLASDIIISDVQQSLGSACIMKAKQKKHQKGMKNRPKGSCDPPTPR